LVLQQERTDKPVGSFIDRIGIFPPLLWGYAGLLLFMIGDGVEAGYLSKYLVDRKIADEKTVAVVFTVYGITVAISAWLSGALSDLWGPRKVMGLGLGIWAMCEVGFLLLGVAPGDYYPLLIMYALRGFGYPLFAYGFLVWISVAAPRDRLGSAVGWFWFALTGGLMTLGPLFASYAIPAIGPYETLWCSLGLVVLGGSPRCNTKCPVASRATVGFISTPGGKAIGKSFWKACTRSSLGRRRGRRFPFARAEGAYPA
jgi:MFS family permease